ncbi:uncharacterized protein LOC124889635 [Capsicum annuum]|uniref:uncharacterized protein LOC124889635 n=1 Tax=Capsicum annuum TaxID=4072 RepID=UPI001FB15881|nr:uncharacterized protein LOC124889635 [Capsicum annuum]
MARGRGSTGRVGKFVVRSNPIVTANIPTIPTPTTVSPQAGGIGGQDDTNQLQPLIPHNMTQCRGRGRGSTGCVGKSAIRSIPTITVNMPTILAAVSPQTDGIGGKNETNQVQSLIPYSTPVVQTSDHGSNPTTPELSPTALNQSNPIAEGTLTQTNQVGEGVSARNTTGEAAKMGQDPTPSKLNLHVHTHDHDEKYSVDERSRIVHASSSASNESEPVVDLDEFVKRLIPALKNQFIPIVIKEVQKLISSQSVVIPRAATFDYLDPLHLDDD